MADSVSLLLSDMLKCKIRRLKEATMNRPFRINWLVMLAVVVASVALISSASQAIAETTLEKIKKQGYIYMGFANERPFSYAEPDGTLVGVDVEILRYIMNKMEIKEIKGGLTTFGGLIPGLKANRFDLVSSAIYIKPDRCKQVAFAEPTYIVGDTVIIKKGNPKGIHSYLDVVKDPSIIIGYPIGGTGVSDKALAMGVKKDQMIGFADGPTAFAAVKTGRVHGYATSALIGRAQLRELNDPELDEAKPFAQPVIKGKVAYGVCSFAVRKEDIDLLNEINKHLLEFRGTPEYIAILEKFNLSKDDLPTTETTAKVCAGE